MAVSDRPAGLAAGYDPGAQDGRVRPGNVIDAVARVRARIAAAGADPARVRIVAVTKGFGPEAVKAVTAAGVADVGESYAQELVAKAAATEGTGVRWHFVGRVQRNKVAALAAMVHLWQGVDRLATGEAIARRAPGARVLVQVNLSGEAHKGGCPQGDTERLVDQCAALGLDVQGLMGIGPAGVPDHARSGFRWLAAAARRLGLPEVSMGMTGDLEVAVQEGATMVRVGRGLFGDRPRHGGGAAVGSLAGGD